MCISVEVGKSNANVHLQTDTQSFGARGVVNKLCTMQPIHQIKRVYKWHFKTLLLACVDTKNILTVDWNAAWLYFIINTQRY